MSSADILLSTKLMNISSNRLIKEDKMGQENVQMGKKLILVQKLKPYRIYSLIVRLKIIRILLFLLKNTSMQMSGEIFAFIFMVL